MKKYKLGEELNDLAYWLSKTEQERLAGLETIRQQYIRLFCHGNKPRFQKVYRVLDLGIK